MTSYVDARYRTKCYWHGKNVVLTKFHLTSTFNNSMEKVEAHIYLKLCLFLEEAVLAESNGRGFEWYIIVVSTVSGMTFGILLSCIVCCYHRRSFSNKNPGHEKTELDRSSKIERNREKESAETDSTYQELDLTKMNNEDAYQSLNVKGNTGDNDAENGDDSAYTELSIIRDVESCYESLA